MKLKKGDIIIVLILILAVSAWFVYSSFSSSAVDKQIVIEINGQVQDKISMKDITENKHMHIELDNGKYIDIALDSSGVLVSDVICPDKLCEKTGKITKPGQSIVCLPNKVVIYIQGQNDSQIDGVAY